MMGPMPPVDYLDAHERHWEDAELLLEHARDANADQLFGLSVECGLKFVMHGLGQLPLDDAGRPEHPKDQGHVETYWLRYVAKSTGRNAPSLPAQNPFADWSVLQRYAPRSVVSTASVEAHRRAARLVNELVRTHLRQGGPL